MESENINKTIISGSITLIILVAAVIYWTASATNTANLASKIEAKRGVIAPIPTIDLEFLSSETLSKRTFNGALPIKLDAYSFGKTDPFAN